jgi:hypothetical protein
MIKFDTEVSSISGPPGLEFLLGDPVSGSVVYDVDDFWLYYTSTNITRYSYLPHSLKNVVTLRIGEANPIIGWVEGILIVDNPIGAPGIQRLGVLFYVPICAYSEALSEACHGSVHLDVPIGTWAPGKLPTEFSGTLQGGESYFLEVLVQVKTTSASGELMFPEAGPFTRIFHPYPSPLRHGR